MGGWLMPDWPAPTVVHAVCTTRHAPLGTTGGSKAPWNDFNLGDHVGDDPTAVARNRDMLRRVLRARPVFLSQVHGTQVLRLDAVTAEGAVADAAVTSETGLACTIMVADCLPVLFANRAGTVVGAAHAGWRGLVAGVLETTVLQMRTPARRLQAWLGPCAGPQAYEIGAEVRAAFVDAQPEAAAAFVPTRPGHWRVDLPLLARQRLTAAGMTLHAIHGGAHCTISDPARFFSHRRDQRSGRMATLAWIAS